MLLEAYSRIGNIKDATGVFRQMQEAWCVPNAETYSIMLDLYGKNGRYGDARELFLEMKVSNTEPDVATYNILVDVFGEGGYFKEVVTLFHDIVEENVEPNMGTYEGLIFACGKASQRLRLTIYMFARGGLYKKTEAVLLKMGESEVARDRDSFNGVIEGFRQDGQFEEAIKAYVEMERGRLGRVRSNIRKLEHWEYCRMSCMHIKAFHPLSLLGPLVFRWNDAYELLNEMSTNRASNIHQVIGQMIKGDFDDDSNWQMDLGRKCIHSNICLARENVWNIHNREDLPPLATVVVV
uniref:Pentacotripeptide-repeat region of PRORP domain-containing protein n=1 Tax=Populus trichocarpa TaxID=3694 RepID=A0A2K1YAA7_POPTR